jgi:hypothetical protein
MLDMNIFISRRACLSREHTWVHRHALIIPTVHIITWLHIRSHVLLITIPMFIIIWRASARTSSPIMVIVEIAVATSSILVFRNQLLPWKISRIVHNV